MITAKFNPTVQFWLIAFAIASPIALVSSIARIFFSRDLLFIIAGNLVFLVIILFFIRLVTRAKYVELSSDSILVKSLFGYGKAVSYSLGTIDGFRTSTFNGRTRSHKAIYIMSGNKKIAAISELYHSNYDEMMHFCGVNLKHLGTVKASIFY